MRILIVDDDRDTAVAFADLLRLKGHETRAVCDGGDALSVAASMQPDVGLVDLQMPFLNGYELAHRIKRDPRLRSMVLIAVSGFARPFDRRRALATGFDEHLPKPVDVARLDELLSKIAGERGITPRTDVGGAGSEAAVG